MYTDPFTFFHHYPLSQHARVCRVQANVRRAD